MRAGLEGRDGLTLLETLAVLVLLAVLVAAAVPRVFPGGMAVQTTARELAGDLALARQLAVSTGQPHTVEFRPPGGPYTAYTLRKDGGPDEPGFPKNLPRGVVAQGPGSVTFMPSGATDLDVPWADWQVSTGSDSATVRLWALTGYARPTR